MYNSRWGVRILGDFHAKDHVLFFAGFMKLCPSLIWNSINDYNNYKMQLSNCTNWLQINLLTIILFYFMWTKLHVHLSCNNITCIIMCTSGSEGSTKMLSGGGRSLASAAARAIPAARKKSRKLILVDIYVIETGSVPQSCLRQLRAR